MASRIRRTLPVFCLSLVLSLPLQAQATPGPAGTLSDFLSALWARLGAPVASLFAADETDGRGALDPDGQTTNSDGRGACDPDGVTACNN